MCSAGSNHTIEILNKSNLQQPKTLKARRYESQSKYLISYLGNSAFNASFGVMTAKRLVSRNLSMAVLAGSHALYLLLLLPLLLLLRRY